MTGFEWAADYEALCSSYNFSVTSGAHGKELKATAAAAPGQVLLTESPLVAWPVRASAGVDEFSCCENCLRIRPFHADQHQHAQKVRVGAGALPCRAPASAPLGENCGSSPAGGSQPGGSDEDEGGVSVHDPKAGVLWFCSTRCRQQALGVALSDVNPSSALATRISDLPESRKRDTCGYIKESGRSEQPVSGLTNDGGASSHGVRRVCGWQEFLSPESLRTLRLHDLQHRSPRPEDSVQEDSQNPIGVEALGRVVARVAATAASLHQVGGWKVEDAYAEACRPFLRFVAAEAAEAHVAFDIKSAGALLQAALGTSVAAALGTDIAAALLGCDALAFLYGVLMRNAQSLLIWGATNEGTLMVLRAAGVYVLQACCNHSCVPNCCVENGADACISLRAERDIAAGEELTITYVPLGLPQSRRQELLDNYRFTCDCSRCAQEKQLRS